MDCIVPGYCWSEFEFGYDCVAPGSETPCFDCQSFPQQSGDGCNGIPEHYDEGYLSESTYQGGENFCNELEECPDEGRIAMTLDHYRRGDVAALRGLLSDSKGSLFVNEERAALQAFDCTGATILHLPLSADFVSALSEEESLNGISGTPLLLFASIVGLASGRRRKTQG